MEQLAAVREGTSHGGIVALWVERRPARSWCSSSGARRRKIPAQTGLREMMLLLIKALAARVMLHEPPSLARSGCTRFFVPAAQIPTDRRGRKVNPRRAGRRHQACHPERLVGVSATRDRRGLR
jgi:hypothetical protein